MNNKTLSIGVLSITAMILFIAQFIPLRPANAAEVVWKDRDYTMLTARSAKGGDVLYVLDNRNGQGVVFVWDAAQRAFIPGRGVLLSDLFK